MRKNEEVEFLCCAAIPEEVLIEAQNELLEWGLSGSSVMEVSHRSDLFAEVAASSTKDIKALLKYWRRS